MDKRGEELRDIMHQAIDKYGRTSKEALSASQNLDQYMNSYYSKTKC